MMDCNPEDIMPRRRGAAVSYAVAVVVLATSLAGAAACRPEPESPAAPQPAEYVDARARRYVSEALDAYHRHRYQTALALTDSAGQYQDDLPELHFLRGRVYFELGRMDEARAAYQRVIALNPAFEGVWHNLGNVSFRQKRYREALGHYRRETSLRNDPNPWHGMGGTFWTLGIADSARWAYEKAIEADAKYAPAYASLAEWYESEGAFEEALRLARNALQRDTANTDYRYRVGALLFRVGEYEESERQLRRVVDAQP